MQYNAMYDLLVTITDDGVSEITPLYPVKENSNVRSDMKSEDWQDIENVRNKAIGQLAEVCAAMGLSWTATDKVFHIMLPDLMIVKVNKDTSIYLSTEPPTRRKTFDISTWGEPGPVEGLPDDMQLPDYGEILDEGVPPQGDKDAEK